MASVLLERMESSVALLKRSICDRRGMREDGRSIVTVL